MTEEGTGGRRETRIDRINLLTPSRTALTLEGRMETHSTKRLHAHGHHQLLTIRDGVTLLVDAARGQHDKTGRRANPNPPGLDEVQWR